MQYLYAEGCKCPQCVKKAPLHVIARNEAISLGAKEAISRLFKIAEKAAKKLHEKGNYDAADLAKVKEYKSLITETASLFQSAITDNDVPEAMAKALKEDVFLFSGLKTHAQLYEASRLLRGEDGKIKTFEAFANDFNAINEKYNQTYLQAEYQYSIAASQSAANWANLDDNAMLQYRTAQDDRVRASHQPLHNVTLPKEDPFWSSYYPPNGWRCRCVAAEVRKGKYEESSSSDAIAAGEAATTEIGTDGKNRLEIFRFNPGKEKIIFPPDHPYSKVKDAEKAKSALT